MIRGSCSWDSSKKLSLPKFNDFPIWWTATRVIQFTEKVSRSHSLFKETTYALKIGVLTTKTYDIVHIYIRFYSFLFEFLLTTNHLSNILNFKFFCRLYTHQEFLITNDYIFYHTLFHNYFIWQIITNSMLFLHKFTTFLISINYFIN